MVDNSGAEAALTIYASLALTGLLLTLSLGVELTLSVRRSGRRAMTRAWRLIHAGQLEEGQRLLRPFLDSPQPQQREPARIALLAAARIAGETLAVQRLLGRIDRAVLSAENRRILAEEEVRAYLVLGQPARAVAAAAELLRQPGTTEEQQRALELSAYALLWDGRYTAARAALTRLLEGGGRPAQHRAWVLYQLGQLCRKERREGEAQRYLEQAAALAGDTPVGRYAREALRLGSIPQRL